jgi:hypothetical protein
MTENQESVLVEWNKIPLNNNVTFKLRDAEAIKSGTNQYGNWHLWVGEFDGVNATQGRGPTAKNVTDYKGEAIFFTRDNQNKLLEQLADGKKGASITATRKPDVIIDRATGRERPIIKTEFSKVSDGVASSTGMTDSELQVFSDALSLVKKGYPITQDIMIQQCASKGISESRAKELFVALEGQKSE